MVFKNENVFEENKNCRIFFKNYLKIPIKYNSLLLIFNEILQIIYYLLIFYRRLNSMQ